MDGWKVSRDPAQAALSLLQVSGDIRVARLDRTDYTRVHPQRGRRARAAVGRCGCCGPQAFTALSAERLLPGQDAQPWEKQVRLHVLSLTIGCHCLLWARPGTSYFVPCGVISFPLRSFLLDICKDMKWLVLETGNISKSRFQWGKERWETLKIFESPWQCGLAGWRVVLYTKKSRV